MPNISLHSTLRRDMDPLGQGRLR